MSQPVEDYEQLGHTFLGGNGNHHLVIAHVEEILEQVRQIEWWRLAIYIPAGLVVLGMGVLTAAGLVPGLVLAAVVLSLAGLAVLMIRRHSIRAMPVGAPKQFKRGQWASPAAARAHASATIYKQRQHAARHRKAAR